jgi:prepilin-type N-terminal cleavage/methylation domain-containing protein
MSRVFSRRFSSRSSRRVGFTLVELLVVIAIIGTLVALLMPAVQSAREAARRMSCSNNLHNIALAVQNYHDSVGSFPSGYICTLDREGKIINDIEAWGWAALILPFIEQKNLHDQIGVTRGSLYDAVKSNPNLIVPSLKTPLQIFMCPSDTGFEGRGQATNARNFQVGLGFVAVGQTSAPGANTGVSNYLGVSGHRDVGGIAPNTGVFFGNSYVRMSDIIDGTSNTFMVGERQTIDCNSGTWVGVCRPQGTAQRGNPMVVGTNRAKLNESTVTFKFNLCNGCGTGFSSMHPNGAQFASVDGAVRFVSNSIDYNWHPKSSVATCEYNGSVNDSKVDANRIYQRLMTRNDKLTVADFQ